MPSPKLVVQALKFATPMPELLPKLGVSTFLDASTRGWSALADDDARMVILKARKERDGKMVTVTYRLPYESIQYYQATAGKADESGEPAEPK